MIQRVFIGRVSGPPYIRPLTTEAIKSLLEDLNRALGRA